MTRIPTHMRRKRTRTGMMHTTMRRTSPRGW